MAIQLGLEIAGIERLEKALGTLPEFAQQGMKDVATTLRNLVRGRTPFDSGELKRSWSAVEQTTTGFTFGTDKDYATILEEGRYKSVGPRTVDVSGKIFSRQAPGGIIGPIVEDDAVLRKVAQTVANEIAIQLERAV